MNKEIYDKLSYQIDKKDDQREEAKKEYFETLEKNSKKLYDKVWTTILKEYKYSEDKNIVIPITIEVTDVYNDTYEVTVQKVNSINDKEPFNRMLFTKSIFEQLLVEDFTPEENLTVKSNEVGKYVYKIVAKEEDLRSMLIKNAPSYDNEELVRSYKSTKVRGK